MKSNISHRIFLIFYLLVLLISPVAADERITVDRSPKENSFVEILNIDISGNKDLDYYQRNKSGNSIFKSGIESFAVDKNEKIYLSNFATGKIKIYSENLAEGEIDISAFSQPKDIEITADMLYIFEDSGKVTEKYFDIKKDIDTEKDIHNEGINIEQYKKQENKYQIPVVTEEGRDEEIINAIPLRFINNYQDDQTSILYDNHNLYFFKDNQFKEFNLNHFTTPNLSDYKQIIGVDENGFIYISGTEIKNINDQIEIREIIYKFNSAGDLLAAADTVNEKNEIVPFKYIDLNSSGDVFQLLVLEDNVKVYRLKFKAINELELEGEDSNSVKISAKIDPENIEKRKILYDRALELLNYKWIYKPELHGGILKNQLIPYYLKRIKRKQELKGIPYTWGGFDSLNTRSLNQKWSNFTDALSRGAAIGNFGLTANYLPGTAGLDCSGLISAVLGLESRKPSWYFFYNNELVKKINYNQLEFMDILVKNGHMLFYLTETDYGIRSIESNTLGSEWKVKYFYWSWRALRDMGYSARGYRNIDIF